MSSKVSQPDAPSAPSTRSGELDPDERSVDYLICRDCSTPCYIFEMESDRITEAFCTVCGNQDAVNFTIGDLEEDS